MLIFLREAGQAKREKILQEITEVNVSYLPEELAYFDSTPTEILPYLYLIGETRPSKVQKMNQ